MVWTVRLLSNPHVRLSTELFLLIKTKKMRLKFKMSSRFTTLDPCALKVFAQTERYRMTIRWVVNSARPERNLNERQDKEENDVDLRS